MEQYLDLDRCSERHSEYYDGEMFPIETAGIDHGEIQGNIYDALRELFKGRPCRAFVSSVRVRIPNTRRYTYPDVLAACGALELEDNKRDTLLNPTVLFEILSPSTEGFDRGEKFAMYRTIPSLQEYVLVSQKHVMVERFRRQTTDNWQFEAITALDGSLRLESLGVEIPVRDIYSNVELVSED